VSALTGADFGLGWEEPVLLDVGSGMLWSVNGVNVLMLCNFSENPTEWNNLMVGTTLRLGITVSSRASGNDDALTVFPALIERLELYTLA